MTDTDKSVAEDSILQSTDSNVSDSEFTDPQQLISDSAFIGDYTLDELIEPIRSQFNNYITTDDRTNYVEIFYKQFEESNSVAYNESNQSESENRVDALSNTYSSFIESIVTLFSERLGLGINGIDENFVEYSELKLIISRLYEYFILRATTNFKVVISYDIMRNLNPAVNITDDNILQRIVSAMPNYSPIITSVTPEDFLKVTGDKEIIDLFESNRVVGNFLVKYTPKLYENEVFGIEVVNYITGRYVLTMAAAKSGNTDVPTNSSKLTVPEKINTEDTING